MYLMVFIEDVVSIRTFLMVEWKDVAKDLPT